MVAAITAGAVLGSAFIQADASESASQVQQQASERSIASREAGDARALEINQKNYQDQIALRKEQYAKFSDLLKPWITAGTDASAKQGELIGLGGPEAQQAAIDRLKNGPEFGSLKTVGENAILANASATGGLRGGTVQGGLAQYDQSLLSKLINDQYARLGGISTTGATAATNLGGAAMSVGGVTPTPYHPVDNSGDINAAGAAEAGGILGDARALTGAVNGLTNAAGVFLGGQRMPVATTSNGTPLQGSGGSGFGGGPVFS